MQRILFIDRRNTARSQMAEAWFNQFAGPGAVAQSCGTMPAAAMDQLTVNVMYEVGVAMPNPTSKAVDTILLATADIVALMGKDVDPGAFTPDYVWDFQDPTGKDERHYRVQRDAIRGQVQELLVTLERMRYTVPRYDWMQPSMLERELVTRQTLGA